MSEEYVHGLELAVPLVVAAVCAVAGLRGARREKSARRRVARLFGGCVAAGSVSRLREWARRVTAARGGLPAAGAGITGIVLVGGAAGCVVGCVVAYGVWRWWRSLKRVAGEASAPSAEEVLRQLPLVTDLLAACLAAGAGPCGAAEATGESFGGLVGERLARAAAEVRLGAEPTEAWGRLGSLPGTRGVALCLERAHESGVPAMESMSRLADRLRAAQGRAAGIRARRAGVLATAPLGLCFLPAFLTVGVVPMVVGLAGGLTAGK